MATHDAGAGADAAVQDEDGYYVEETISTIQPLNLSRAAPECDYQSAQEQEDEQEEEPEEERERRFVYENCGPASGSGPRALDAHFRRAIDARTLRDLENMSQYLLQVPTPSSAGPHCPRSMMMDPCEDGEGEGDERNVDEEHDQDQDHDQDHDHDHDQDPEDATAENDEHEGDGDGDADGDEGAAGGTDENQDGCDVGISLSGMNSETEVMRAARALFSKRTRTLYHWMYPDTPKMHLKAVVANAWDAMLTAEKQFYVSQVLGKFGCLQSQLMVNPQLGLFATTQSQGQGQGGGQAPATPPCPQMPMQAPQQQLQHYMDATHSRAHAPGQYAHAQYVQYAPMGPVGPIRRRRGRPRGSLHSRVLQQRYGDMPSIYAQRLHAVKRLAEGNLPLPIRRHHRGVAPGAVTSSTQRVTCAAISENEFNDDPELRNEFEKFEWTMHMVE